MTGMTRPCFLLTAQRGYALASSRRKLIEAYLGADWQVVVATADDEYAQQLVSWGAELAPIAFRRGGFYPVRDAGAGAALWRAMRRYRPRLVHNFHAKAIILSSVAARLVLGREVKVVNTITGLGHAFIAGGTVRRLVSLGYRIALTRTDLTIFQNDDDRDLFVGSGWVAAERACTIVGSGIDVQQFHPVPDTPPAGERVLMMARLLWQKGVREFVEAARLVRGRRPDVVFLLAGETDRTHRDAVPARYLEQAVAEGHIEYPGYLTDPHRTLATSTLCVLPSYREGAPRVVLEAAACGVPSVGADVPGTRQAIHDGETGLLVPVRDADALAAAILSLLANPERRLALGRRARQLAEEEFAAEVIAARHFALYRELGVGPDHPVPDDRRRQ